MAQLTTPVFSFVCGHCHCFSLLLPRLPLMTILLTRAVLSWLMSCRCKCVCVYLLKSDSSISAERSRFLPPPLFPLCSYSCHSTGTQPGTVIDIGGGDGRQVPQPPQPPPPPPPPPPALFAEPVFFTTTTTATKSQSWARRGFAKKKWRGAATEQ